ncbi:MAG: hypothetical protein R3E95_01805 [Thiolinea sp.]
MVDPGNEWRHGHSALFNQTPNSGNSRSLHLERQAQDIGKTFGMRALYDISYRLANAAMKPWYPHYQTHRPANALWEYLGWGKRMPVTKLWHTPRKTALIRKLVTDKIPYYPFPLQLDADAQIRVHSPYDDVEHAIRTVMQSFARHAPADSHLVIKNHPLAGIINHRQQVKH